MNVARAARDRPAQRATIDGIGVGIGRPRPQELPLRGLPAADRVSHALAVRVAEGDAP